jgi:preprotein translocase subunit YajC
MTGTTLGVLLLFFAAVQLCIFGLIRNRQRRPQTEEVINELKKLDRISRGLQIFAFSVVLFMFLKGVV